MPTWVRITVVLVVLTGWSAVVAAYLLQGKLPDAVVLGIPAAVILAAAPLPSRARTPRKPRAKPAEDATK